MVQRMFLLLLLLSPIVSISQTVQVEKAGFRIEGENISGYQTPLASVEADVQHALMKFLKPFGKVKHDDGVISIAEPLIAGKKYSNTLYAATRQVAATTAAWMGMRGSGDESNTNSDLEKLVYDFGVTFYRDKIQLQVDESLRALQTVEKQQIRLANQKKDLNSKVENNKREKIQLEKSLAENKLELEDLIKKLAANVKAQDSIAIATEQIKKVVEIHKEKQRKIK
jgi:hypothetical protein